MERVDEDQSVGQDSSNSYEARENLWDEQWPGTGPDGAVHAQPSIDSLDEMSEFPDTVGTTDPIRAAQDAEPYMPPIDPPVLPGGKEGIVTATGFGIDVEETTSRGAPYANDSDLEEEVVLMLREDSLASHWNLQPTVVAGVVTIRGAVPTAQDAEYIESLVGGIQGVEDVEDETTINPDLTS